MTDETRAILAQGLLGSLSDASIETLAAAGRIVSCHGGTSLMEAGSEGDTAYVVLRGRLRILRVPVGEETPIVVGEVGPGDIVGEMALLASGHRTATVVAVRDTELLEIDAKLFDEVTSRETTTARELTRLIFERATASKTPRTEPRVITLVLDREPTTSDFPEHVRAAFAAIGENPLLGFGDHERDDRGAELVRSAESEGRLLILVTEAGNDAACEAAIRQADVVVPVASMPGSTTCEIVAGHLRSRPYAPQVEAVSVGNAPTPRAAMEPGVRRHRIERAGRELERVARLVFGRSTVLVLGSGSARGLAHIGVVQALRELDVEFDAVGGTSAGAIIAGATALGRSTDGMRSDMIDFIRGVQWRRDLTIPTLALMTGRQMSNAIEDYFGDVLIEDLSLPMFAVSTDLSAGRAVVHDRGPAWLAIRASASIPGIFPPVRDRDRLLADGAIVDRLPVGVMRTLHPDSNVISVDVSTPRDMPVTGHADDGRLGRRQTLLGGRGRRSRTGIGSLMGRIIELTGTKDDPADILIRPRFDGTGLRNASQIVDQAITAGYEATMETMGEAG